eukprot:CAMPEP_0114045868 /NCGR_PEP_ID=MMETSP1339-20121228/11544_1 /TAXON_ID=94617 /ORGANISM="Fibrocapsa japonica" /LENGTH=37 /assembly_acc=CAM_ASM_000762
MAKTTAATFAAMKSGALGGDHFDEDGDGTPPPGTLTE